MAKLVSFQCDKQLAKPGGGSPQVAAETIKITFYAVGENNVGVEVPLLVKTTEPKGAILYYNSDYQPVSVDDNSSVHISTEPDGRAVLYLCAPYAILFTLFATINLPGEDFRSLELLFFDFNLSPGEGLLPPNLSLTRGKVVIPPWNQLSYGANANVQLSTSTYRMAAIVCNNYVRIGDPSMLTDNFIVPYQTMLPGGKQNSLAYVLRTGTNTLSSPVVSFMVSGQGLVMPDPDKGASFAPPTWIGGNATRLTTYDIAPDLVLNITLVEGVQEGDTYDVHIYINGYDENGMFMPPAPVKIYTVTAPKDPKPGQQVECRIKMQDLQGYCRKDPKDWGYMWADCLITSAAWSFSSGWTFPWGPIEIDFF